MTEALPARATPTQRWQTAPLAKRITSYVLLASVFFLLGFLPLWASARGATARHAETARQLRLVQLQTGLASAVIDAQRGEHAAALDLVSSIFTSLQSQLDQGEASDFSAAQRAELQPLLGGRDELIALLARGDADSGARLAALYQSFSQILTGQAALATEVGARRP